jgi:lantibiotic transport system ATP-binding protein
VTSSLAIETRSLTRSFGSKSAVSDLNLQVPAGSIYGFLGPNGAGKTTTIRLILGLLRPSSGRVFLAGREVKAGAAYQELRGVGTLVETPSLYPNLTGRENLEVARRLLDVPVSEIGTVLDLMDLTEDADRMVRTYSMGMRQRLGLARACLGEPRLLILDEPTNGLDPEGVRDLRKLLRQLASERGVTVFLSSHLLSEIDQMAEYIGILRQGELIYQGELGGLRKYQRELHVRVDLPARAQEVLNASGWFTEAQDDGSLRVFLASEPDSAGVARVLVQAGIGVYALHPAKPTLEELFLQLVGHPEIAHA